MLCIRDTSTNVPSSQSALLTWTVCGAGRAHNMASRRRMRLSTYSRASSLAVSVGCTCFNTCGMIYNVSESPLHHSSHIITLIELTITVQVKKLSWQWSGQNLKIHKVLYLSLQLNGNTGKIQSRTIWVPSPLGLFNQVGKTTLFRSLSVTVLKRKQENMED